MNIFQKIWKRLTCKSKEETRVIIDCGFTTETVEVKEPYTDEEINQYWGIILRNAIKNEWIKDYKTINKFCNKFVILDKTTNRLYIDGVKWEDIPTTTEIKKLANAWRVLHFKCTFEPLDTYMKSLN